MKVANLRIVVTLEIRTRISGGLMTKLSKEDKKYYIGAYIFFILVN